MVGFTEKKLNYLTQNKTVAENRVFVIWSHSSKSRKMSERRCWKQQNFHLPNLTAFLSFWLVWQIHRQL